MSERILLVDDDWETLRLVGTVLEKEGYEIVATRSGSEAVEMAEAQQPSLILLDIGMPDADGTQVCRDLRASPVAVDIPVIMFTARDGQRTEAFAAGADDFVTKPVAREELLARVGNMLKRSRRQEERLTLRERLADWCR
jgi:DNA-binding response OmpR family regulator